MACSLCSPDVPAARYVHAIDLASSLGQQLQELLGPAAPPHETGSRAGLLALCSRRPPEVSHACLEEGVPLVAAALAFVKNLRRQRPALFPSVAPAATSLALMNMSLDEHDFGFQPLSASTPEAPRRINGVCCCWCCVVVVVLLLCASAMRGRCASFLCPRRLSQKNSRISFWYAPRGAVV